MLLTIGDWDPTRQSLRAWVSETMYRDHPYLRASAYGREIVERLFQARHLALFLDGFDEMPAETRANALKALSREPSAAIVLTSRPAEYRGVAPLEAATVIELERVSAEDAGHYLTQNRSEDRSRWLGVARALRANPTSPLAAALNSPLLLTLARRADPSELLDAGRFPTADAVRRYLLAGLLESAFPANGEIETSYLRSIARALEEEETRELAWWRLRRQVPWAPSVAIAAASALSEVLTTGVAGNWRVALYCGVAWLVTGAAAGSLVSSVGQRITVRPVTGVGPNVLAGLLLGVMFGFGMSALSQLFEQGLGLAAAVGYGIVFGAGLGLVAGIVGLRDGPLSASLRLPGRDHLAGAVCCGVATWAAFSDTLGTTQAILVGASNGIAFALAVGWTRPSDAHALRRRRRAPIATTSERADCSP